MYIYLWYTLYIYIYIYCVYKNCIYIYIYIFIFNVYIHCIYTFVAWTDFASPPRPHLSWDLPYSGNICNVYKLKTRKLKHLASL